MATIETALTRLLHIRHPILNAPMSGTAGGVLANAVSHAGGLGIVGPRPDEAAVRRELAAAGNARVAVGFITWRLAGNPAETVIERIVAQAVATLRAGAALVSG